MNKLTLFLIAIGITGSTVALSSTPVINLLPTPEIQDLSTTSLHAPFSGFYVGLSIGGVQNQADLKDQEYAQYQLLTIQGNLVQAEFFRKEEILFLV